MNMRCHHEEFAAAPSILPALSLLVPLAGALWARIKTGRKKDGDQPNASREGGCGAIES